LLPCPLERRKLPLEHFLSLLVFFLPIGNALFPIGKMFFPCPVCLLPDLNRVDSLLHYLHETRMWENIHWS
jgi:hypothetical protein